MDEKPKLRPVEVFPVETGKRQLIGVRDATGLSDRVVTVSAGVLGLLSMLDGKHNILDIQAEIVRQSGEIVASDDIRRMLGVLDEALLLEGERFDAWRKQITEEFTNSPVRKAASAGGSYPAKPQELRKFLDDVLAEAELPQSRGELRGLIAPHIDYSRGRRSYADAYASLERSGPAELFILLGTSHADTSERFALTRKDFQTPLGLARTDTEFVDALVERSGRDLLADEFVHRGEHSIELELVFVQHLCLRAKAPFRVVPILCGSLQQAMEEDTSPMGLPGVREVVDGLREMVAKEKRRVVVIAGADLSHVGPRFGGGARVTRGTLHSLDRADRETLAFVEKGDAQGFFQHVALDENARHICGVAPILVALESLEAKEAGLLRYEQWSADDGSSCVTFAACVIT